jgi:MFS family permease
MGNRFHWIAISLWIYALTHSASAVSIAISSMFAGGLLVSLWAGVFVDRFDRRRILIGADLIRAALVLAIPSLIQTNIWLVYVDLILISAATAFFKPAIFAVVPTTVARPSLMAANSLFSAMDTGTEMVGPIVAGVLAEVFGYAPLLYFDAATYVFSSLCIALMMLRPPTEHGLGSMNLGSLWKSVAEGLQYIRRDPLQWGLFVLIFPATLVGTGLNALQTPLAKGTVGITDAQFGTFNSVWGIGFLVASLLLGWYGTTMRRGILILSGYFLGFVATGFMGLSRSFQHLLLTAFMVGFSNTMYYVGLGTVLMEHTPSAFIGRVISTRQLALGFVRVVSPLVFGVLAEAIGIRVAIVAMATTGVFGTTAVVVWLPSLWFLGRGVERVGTNTRIWGWTIGSIDIEVEETRQHRMNALTLICALIAIVFLGYTFRTIALLFVLAIFVFAYLGALAKRRWGDGEGRI